METIGETNEFYSCGVYDGEEFYYFTEKEEAINHLLFKTPKNSYVVATNLLFDFSVLFYNTKWWNKFRIIMNQGRIIEAIYQRKNSKVLFIDTLNYVGFSVKVMGEILGKPKLEHPACLGRCPDNREEYEELKAYNRMDCVITHDFMVFLQDGFYTIGAKTKLTVASTAMDLYRRKYLRFPLFKEQHRLGEGTNDFIFDGYYGGRTESFMRGPLGKAKYYDVNSLYPFAMMEEYPHPNTVKVTFHPHRHIIELYEGTSDVTLVSPQLTYPDLPFRTGEKLIFPTGRWRGVYTHTDLRRAMEKGYTIEKIHKSIYYKKTFYPFKDYVLDLYEKRLYYKKQKSPMEILYKLLLNSLYGKFAQRKMNDIKFFDLRYFSDEEMEEWHHSDDVDTYMNDEHKGFTITKRLCTQAHVFPILSSYTSAHARSVINRYIEENNAFYSDTDSVVTNKHIDTSTKLGGIKVEHDITQGYLVKPKMYMFDTPTRSVVKMKGVPRISKEGFIRVLQKHSVTYQKFSKLKESIRRNMTPNTVMRMEKRIDLEDTKRSWSNPFNMAEWQESTPLKIKQ